jgi:hypothetical protein
VLRDQLFSDRTGHYIITLHAIEMGLKAFLISKGYAQHTHGIEPIRLGSSSAAVDEDAGRLKHVVGNSVVR